MLKLASAIRLTPSSRVALVGAGGKTAAMFRIAQDYIQSTKAGTPSIFLSTSTHLAAGQVQATDQHFIVRNAEDFDAFRYRVPPGSILFTGQFTNSAEHPQRASGLSADLLDQLMLLADEHQLPLLIEADGARNLPLKAPAAHEPAIPKFSNTVIVAAGLSGLGQPLTSDWVHRPEKFAQLSGLPIGKNIGDQHLQRVLLHEEGGLKNIPLHARRLVLFTQAVDAAKQGQAKAMTKALLNQYQAVMISDFNTSQQAGVFAVHEPIAGIILAAGGSSRFGSPKPLLAWQGETFIERITRTALESGCSPVTIIVGDLLEQVQSLVSKWDVKVVHNPDWQIGQSTSIRAGLNAIPSSCGAAIFLLADQPQVNQSIISALIEAHAQSLSPIIVPQVDGKRANPVLFDCSTFQNLLEIQGDQGGRALFSQYHVHWLPWQDQSILSDIDTPQDYQRLLNSQ